MKAELNYIEDVITATRNVDMNTVIKAIDRLEEAYQEQQMVYLIGNGGSGSTATHFAEDLAKGTLPIREPKRFKILSLTDCTPYITAVGNDVSYEEVFSFQLRQFAQQNDVLVAISGSGNSPNIIHAVNYAKEQGVTVIGMTGFDGGQLAALADINIHVPIHDMCKTEAVHSTYIHVIADMLVERFKQ